MSVGSYALSELNSSVSLKTSGAFTGASASANFLTIANQAVREVIAETDLRGTIRSATLSPNLFDEVFEYSCPSDLKGDKIIDVEPQINRGRLDYYRLTTPEEFDRRKEDRRIDTWGDPITLNRRQWYGDNIIAIRRDDLVNKLLISRIVDDEEIQISNLDSLSAGGGVWSTYLGASSIAVDNSNYVKGNASLKWNISPDPETTAGIVNSTLNSSDITKFITAGSGLVWAYITSATNVTNFKILIGSDSSNYYSASATTNNEGASFYAGWNLIRWDFINKETTGSPDSTAIDYCAIYMTKDTSKVSETDYRFDHLILKLGTHQQVRYYSRYGWQSSGGTFLEDSTATTDLLNAETDEIPMIEAKVAQRVEESFGNFKESERFEKDYEKLRQRYILENPSRSLPLVTTYYDVDSEGYETTYGI